MFRSYEWLLVKQSWKGLGFVGLTRALRAHFACFVSGLIGLEQRNLCQRDVTVLVIEPRIVSSPHLTRHD